MTHSSVSETCLPYISVIVPTYNRETVLCVTLDYLLQQHYPAGYEIIVVDQTPQPTKATLAFLAEHSDDIRHVQLETPNLPLARNVGIRVAQGDLIVFCDDDIIVSPDFLLAHACAYTSLDIAGVAGRVITSEREDLGLLGHPTATFLPYGRSTDGFSRQTRTKVDTAQGCNMSFRREALEAVGGFDRHYIGNARREESDLCLRLRRRGYHLQFEPSALAIHLVTHSGGCRNDAWARYLHDIFHNETLFFLRYFDHRYFPQFLGLHWRGLVSPRLYRASLKTRRFCDLLAPWEGLMAGIRTYRQTRGLLLVLQGPLGVLQEVRR